MIELKDELLSKYTTFRTGGPAKRLVQPETAAELAELVKSLKENNEEYIVIGNGSNLLISDKGYNGMVIFIGEKLGEIKVQGSTIYAGAGAMLSAVARAARDNSLAGFEFASGIPGSVGGAVFMNAGAYGGEICQVTEYVDVLMDGELKRLDASEMQFSYRHSVAMEKEMIILGLCIKLQSGNRDEITEKMSELNKKRVEKQPLEYPSAGSTFKRPEGYFAGKLIQDSGLAGYRVGGAMVSPKHCGFVINYENATADDIYRLMQDVTRIVEEKFGVTLEPEVRLIGDFS
ncbi:MAG: UDP-N-acetylmuramate dehydrogenase [Eubacterium sp.]|nr:UDP-N-acetylmuramate dehydrogenase [Eubacterium sp.]